MLEFRVMASGIRAGVLPRTASARVRMALSCWRREQESVMTEHPPKHTPIATDRPQLTALTALEERARVEAHVKAMLRRLKERLRQAP